MQIGIIGGIGPAAQDYYTRALIGIFARAGVALEMTAAHADAPTVLANLAVDARAEQAALFAGLARRLAQAGAGCVAVTSIGGHFCRAEFAALSPLPVIDMIDAVAAEVAARGLERIGVLGTRTVMETRFYGGIASAELIVPEAAELGQVHDAYVAMAAVGTITAAQRGLFHRAAAGLIARGAQAVMLGGTDLTLAFGPSDGPGPLVDCAAIHVAAIARHAMAG